jgi:hypothetical protein
MSAETYSNINSDHYIDELKTYISFDHGEIYSIAKNQVAVNYANKGRGNDPFKYPTLEIIRVL